MINLHFYSKSHLTLNGLDFMRQLPCFCIDHAENDKSLWVAFMEKWDLPLSMSNLALSLPSSTILPGRDNLKITSADTDGCRHSMQRQNQHRTRSCVLMNEPEEVGLGVELEIGSVDVKVKLWSSGVGHADVEDQVLRVLAQVKCGSNHDDYWYDADLWRPWQGEPWAL